MWKATGDVVKVQSLLGHESLATTQAYIYDSADDFRQAVDDILSYRSHKGVYVVQPRKLLEAYGLPMSLINRILNSRGDRYYRILFLLSGPQGWISYISYDASVLRLTRLRDSDVHVSMCLFTIIGVEH